MRSQKPNEHAKGEEVISQVERRDESRPVFPETDRVDPFDENVVCRWRFRRWPGIAVPRLVQNCLPISRVGVLADKPLTLCNGRLVKLNRRERGGRRAAWFCLYIERECFSSEVMWEFSKRTNGATSRGE